MNSARHGAQARWKGRRPDMLPDRAGKGGFLRREDGSMLILGLFFFVAILLVAGLAVDMMRHENERVRLQATSDRAVIAAAIMRDAEGGPTPHQVIEAFFAAEGLPPSLLGRVEIEQSETSGRRVAIAPRGTVPTIFMRMIGMNELDIAAPAEAATTVTAGRGGAPLDLVMVLDVSSSMNSRNKIGNLRRAAADLAEYLLRDTEPGHVSITMVPYADWVIPPPGFLNFFTNIPQTNDTCADFTIWNNVTNNLSQPMTRHRCTASVTRTTRAFMHDADTAIAHIQSLMTERGTSIDLGVRFGAVFFDPSIRPAVETMIANEVVHPAFSGRPFAPGTPGVVRAMILMTDGKNNPNGSRSGSSALYDRRTLETCNALKEQGVTIYAVAFEAPGAGIQMMRECASSEAHFFNTSGEGIIDVFAGIGNHISVQVETLRLTR